MDKKLTEKVYVLLAHEWSSVKDIDIEYLETLTKLEVENGVIVLASLLTKYLVTAKKNELVAKLKVIFINIHYIFNKKVVFISNIFYFFIINIMKQIYIFLQTNTIDPFIKLTISCKKKPDLYVVHNAVPLLRRISHDEFKSQLLPALQKAMLRNPEIIIESVGYILSGLSLDLSQYSQDISKGLFANLHSKEDLVRDEAVGACRRLALQCSDTIALENLLSSVFAVFHGSEGKLTVATHKISVLQGAGNLSYNAASGSSVERLAETACEHFIKVLETEVHEKTLIHALEMMALWTNKFANNVPKCVIDAFKKGMTAKTSTAIVRTAYIKLFFSAPVASYSEAITPLLLQSLTRAIQQSAQSAAVTEGLIAAYLLLKFVLVNQVENDKQIILWNAIDEQIFFSEKFLTTCADDILYHLMLLCERLITEFGDRLNEKTLNGVHRAIVACATAPKYKIRKRCFPLIKKILTGLSTYGPAQELLMEYNKFLERVKIKSENDENKEESFNYETTGRCLADGLLAICSGSFLFESPAMQMTRDALIPSHHPAIYKAMPNLWFKIVKNFNLIPKHFLCSFNHEIKKILIQNYKPIASYENALTNVISIIPDIILPVIVSNITSKLDDVEILRVTKDEYFIYLTPEGELYDKSVLPTNDENDILNSMNMKRESKVYSFKEQQEELQLRRELYEKRKKEGKIKEPKLTPKQEEILKTQMAKESTIRKRLTELKLKIDNVVSLTICSMHGNGQELSFYLKDLLPPILKNLGSPLAAPAMSDLYIRLKEIIKINNPVLSDVVAHVTLRQLQPQCDLNHAWEEENLDSAVKRTLNLLHTTAIKQKKLFTAPTFCYIFPFIKKTLLSYKDDNMIVQGLQIIQEHAKQRGNSSDFRDMKHPQLLPRKHMFDLLIELMEITNGRVQTHAVATLLDVAQSGSGQPGTAIATNEDINSLIGALQNSLSTIRDAALRALTVVRQAFPSQKEDPDQLSYLIKRIWIARFDVCDENKILANELWNAADLVMDAEKLSDELIQDTAHPVEPIQQAAACALAQCLTEVPHLVPIILDKLLQMYQDKLAMIPPKLNDFGRIVEQPIDTWGPRRGVALALAQLAPLLSADTVLKLVQFFVSIGLGDRNQAVRTEMLTAAVAVVDLHGKANITSLLPVFEEFMDKAPKIGSFDSIKQSVVILMGSLARHLDKDDSRIKPIVMRLIAALSTPSQQVQEAVANCLPHLVPSIKDDAPSIVDKLMDQLLKSDKYGERKGAAYGLAGIIKGMGILALKQLDIMTTLTNAIQDKKNYRHREGALFAFEMLCTMLGRLFEPYIVHVLPHLLLCFGDSSQYVRTATDDTARVVMSKLSAHGVKLVLPSLLAALEEDSWRTKTGK